MILHSQFHSYDAYLLEVLLFLKNVSWLVDFPGTQMLSRDVFSKVPDEWKVPLLSLSIDELNLFPRGLIKDDWPATLIEFQNMCRKLTLPVLSGSFLNENFVPNKKLSNDLWRGMTPKKKIEVELLSSLVDRECKTLGISNILDIGFGRGYVDRLLLINGYKILGLETNLKMIENTIAQLHKMLPDTKFNCVQLTVNDTSTDDVKEAINKYLIDGNQSGKDTNITVADNVNDISMIGLHACGDLAINSMKLFLNISQIKSLIIVPCCYHKMIPVGGVRNSEINQIYKDLSFHNFPASKTLSEKIKTLDCLSFLQVPFLRLGGQSTSSSWQSYSEGDHENHAFNVLARNIVQLYAIQERKKVQKCFRKIVTKSEREKNNFPVYVKETLKRCNVTDIDGVEQNKDDVYQHMLKLWDTHKDKLKMVEVITGLQMCVESVVESLIVADRTCFLFENGITDVRLVKLFDSKISPRGLVYIATKMRNK